MKASVYNQKGEPTKEIELAEDIFSLPWNADLVHQVIVSMMTNRRFNTASAKDRSQVSGGGKKPWRQKGTGRARHGSSRSPIWIGGGATHGPLTDRTYLKKITKKAKRKALLTILSAKLRDGEIIFVDGFNLAEPKTRQASNFLKLISKADNKPKLNFRRGRRALIALPDNDQATVKSFRNLKQTAVCRAVDLNPLAVAGYQYLIITDPDKSLPIIERSEK